MVTFNKNSSIALTFWDWWTRNEQMFSKVCILFFIRRGTILRPDNCHDFRENRSCLVIMGRVEKVRLSRRRSHWFVYQVSETHEHIGLQPIIFCAHVLGNMTTVSRASVTGCNDEQQAEKMLNRINNHETNKATGQDRKMRTKNHKTAQQIPATDAPISAYSAE